MARRATYIQPLFWQALESFPLTNANFYESPRQTSIDQTKDIVMKSERNELVKVSDLP